MGVLAHVVCRSGRTIKQRARFHTQHWGTRRPSAVGKLIGRRARGANVSRRFVTEIDAQQGDQGVKVAPGLKVGDSRRRDRCAREGGEYQIDAAPGAKANELPRDLQRMGLTRWDCYSGEVEEEEDNGQQARGYSGDSRNSQADKGERGGYGRVHVRDAGRKSVSQSVSPTPPAAAPQ